MDDSTQSVSVSEVLALAAFQKLPKAQVEQIAPLLVRQTYLVGQIIFLEGEPSSGLWFVAKGRVKVIKHSLNGRVQGICLVNRGKCFGSCPLFDIGRNPASAQALDNVTLFILPQPYLHHLERQEPALSSMLLRIYSQRLGHLARLIEGLGTWTVADRINDSLLTYAERTESGLIVRLTHERLAALSGTVREVVTRHLLRLEKEGVLRSEPGQITVIDSSALTLPCLLSADDAAVG